MNHNKPLLIDILKGILIGFIIVIGTFPENDWTYFPGLDSPLAWLFNYSFDSGLEIGKNIIFPHGPLAFFLYPLQENILIALSVTALLKILLVFNFFWISPIKDDSKWFHALIMAYFLSIISGFMHLILANIILLFCNYFKSEKSFYKISAFALTVFAIYVKSYIAVLSAVICFSFFLYYIIKYKNIKKTGIDLLTIIFFLLVFWIGMYGTIDGFIKYGIGLFHLIQDNSSAAAWYPNNNWWVLTIFILITITLPLINKTKESTFYGILIALSFFAAWKHGMAREDATHFKGLIIYTIITLLVFIHFIKPIVFKNILLSSIAIFLLFVNSNRISATETSKYELFRVNNFIDFVSNFSELKAKSTEKINNSISIKKLPQFIIDSIKTSTVDVYPWDYSIISANHLNWQPRVVIHSYASYTSWLDQRNADHFASTLAPEYLIIERFQFGLNGGDYNSIDNRYFFNDEPRTIIEILKNYQFFHSVNNLLILKKNNKPIKTTNLNLGEIESKWDTWINVPKSTEGLLRAKLTFKKSFLQRIKSFLYKDEQFWIYLKLPSGVIHKYRIVPKNAADGLWINPYISGVSQADFVESVMFKSSNQAMLSEEINIKWEQTVFENEPDHLQTFFSLKNISQESLFYSSINPFENIETTNWSMLDEVKLSDTAFTGSKSYILGANAFSPTFSIEMDSLPNDTLTIMADCWIKSPNCKYKKNAILVLSIEDASGSVFWHAVPIYDQIIDKDFWNNIFIKKGYLNNIPGRNLKAYLLNTSSENLFLDDFRILITGHKETSYK